MLLLSFMSYLLIRSGICGVSGSAVGGVNVLQFFSFELGQVKIGNRAKAKQIL